MSRLNESMLTRPAEIDRRSRDLSIRTYHRASAPSVHFAPTSLLSLPIPFAQISITSQHLSHTSKNPTLIPPLSIHVTTKHDAHNIVLFAPNATLLRIHATAIITTLRALCKCKPTDIRLQHVLTPQREIRDATTRVQGQPCDADARRHYKAKEGHVLQARAERPG